MATKKVSRTKTKPKRSPPNEKALEPPNSGERLGIQELRRICLSMPDVAEVQAWGDPTFRVRNKIFAMHKIGRGRISVWCKALPGAQQLLVAKAPDRFFVPPYVGHHGWIGIRLDVDVKWEELERLVEMSYRLTAPKRTLQRKAKT